MVFVLVPTIVMQVAGKVHGDPAAKQPFERIERPVGPIGRIVHRVPRIRRVDRLVNPVRLGVAEDYSITRADPVGNLLEILLLRTIEVGAELDVGAKPPPATP